MPGLNKQLLLIESLPLWDHQRKAIKTILDYLIAAKNGTSQGASLIHLPTGTGKSGVIAVASHFLKNTGCVLVLCPRIALRDQLYKEIDGRFFMKLAQNVPLEKRVYNISRSFPQIEPAKYPESILVMTIQMLYSMARTQNENYLALKNRVDLVIVDEGHYEPAISWREAIRSIKKPKVIFTATPFRNDLKLFDIDYNHAFTYTFHEAVRDAIIRNVIIYPRKHPGTPHDFVEEIVEFYDKQFAGIQATEDNKPRVIIRCDSQATIRQTGTALQAKGKSFILIHENFSDDANVHERHSVPDPNEENSTFWVHQFKLLEGIDDPRFQVLALYEELRSTREFVQQWGGSFVIHSG